MPQPRQRRAHAVTGYADGDTSDVGMCGSPTRVSLNLV